MNITFETKIKQTLSDWTNPMAAFEGNENVTLEGFGDFVLDYYNPTVRLSIEFHTDEGYMRSHLLRKSDEAGLTLIVHFADIEQLTNILNAFSKHKETVTMQNFKVLVTEVLQSCSECFVETEEGLKPLSF